jgi:hypothetical protein
MTVRAVPYLAILGSMLAGNLAAQAGFPHATAIRGCTQEDGQALELYLTQTAYDGRGEPPKPYLRIEIAWGDWSKLTGRDLALVPLSRRGEDAQKHVVRAELHNLRGGPVWLAGTLHLNGVRVDRGVTGSFQFTDRGVDGHPGRWSGTFDARWLARRNGCG